MYRPILATLAFILSENKKEVLLVHRNRRRNDQHLGKYNGLGGKMESGEDVFSCVVREVREEAGIQCEELELRGTINWPGFGPDGEDWLGFIFLVHSFLGTPKLVNEEGDLVWKPLADLDTLPMWEGDKYFLPLVFDGKAGIFHGCMTYEKGRPVSWQYSRT